MKHCKEEQCDLFSRQYTYILIRIYALNMFLMLGLLYNVLVSCQQKCNAPSFITLKQACGWCQQYAHQRRWANLTEMWPLYWPPISYIINKTGIMYMNSMLVTIKPSIRNQLWHIQVIKKVKIIKNKLNAAIITQNMYLLKLYWERFINFVT